MMNYLCCAIFILFFTPLCYASLVEDFFTEGVTVDLREPLYSDGELKTEQGGVIKAPGIRIQAKRILYSRKCHEGKPRRFVYAEGDVMIEYGCHVLVGEKLEYDFLTQSGCLEKGRGAFYPWYFGAETIFLYPNHSYTMKAAFFTTSEDINNDWQILSSQAMISENNYLYAKNLQIRLLNRVIFWIPYFSIDLDFIFDTPIRYYVRIGGRRGTRFGIQYNLFTWKRWKTYLRLDYRLFRGPGGGFEVNYKSPNHKERFEMINYAARDNSISNPSQRFRYRFQGSYRNLLMNDRVAVNLNYDKLSDKDMATDYGDISLKIAIAERTQLIVRRQASSWIANFITKPRFNTFQTLKQELPTIEINQRPFVLGKSKIIMNNNFKASYFDFDYTKKLQNVNDYSSMRLEYQARLHRCFSCKRVNLIPSVGAVAIYYQNTPERKPQLLTTNLFEVELNTYLHRFYSTHKHLLKPYVKYSYYTFPSSIPTQHYIFGIEDGWYRLNLFRIGLLQNLYTKLKNGCITRLLKADLYTYAFINTDTIDQAIPKIYANLVYQFSPFMKHTLQAAWDTQRKQVAHFNVRFEWTFNASFAMSAEYRHRNAWDWRKVDYNNFILDSFQSEKKLRASSLSDRRDTLLVHLYYLFHPNWALEFSSRQGWNRLTEPNYIEYEIDLVGTIRSAWNLSFTYQHREHDDRFAFSFSIGVKRPDEKKFRTQPPHVEF